MFYPGHYSRLNSATTHRLTEIDKENNTAICTVCGPTEIYIYSRVTVCKTAKTSQSLAYRDANKKQSADTARRRRLRVCFRITPEEYDSIAEYQRNHDVFRLVLGKGKLKDSVEHRHSDGLIRGVMAAMLNRAYGIIERLYPNNTSEILRALAEFHDNPPATAALGAPRYGLMGLAKYKKRMVYGPPPGTEVKKTTKRKKRSVSKTTKPDR